MRRRRRGIVRSAALRRDAFSLLNGISMGLRSGEYWGRYLLQMRIPNVYFHIAMAYAILRHNGVDIGKMDFLGPIKWTDA